jgi:hypothetical protein
MTLQEVTPLSEIPSNLEGLPEHQKLYAVDREMNGAATVLRYLADQGILFCQRENATEANDYQDYAPARGFVATRGIYGELSIDHVFRAFGIDRTAFLLEKELILNHLRATFRPRSHNDRGDDHHHHGAL